MKWLHEKKRSKLDKHKHKQTKHTKRSKHKHTQLSIDDKRKSCVKWLHPLLGGGACGAYRAGSKRVSDVSLDASEIEASIIIVLLIIIISSSSSSSSSSCIVIIIIVIIMCLPNQIEVGV